MSEEAILINLLQSHSDGLLAILVLAHCWQTASTVITVTGYEVSNCLFEHCDIELKRTNDFLKFNCVLLLLACSNVQHTWATACIENVARTWPSLVLRVGATV